MPGSFMPICDFGGMGLNMRSASLIESEEKLAQQLIEIRDITPENTVFSRTGGGFVKMTFTTLDGEIKEFERVAVHRCFPFSDPSRFISIREPDGDGKEIGLIPELDDVPAEWRDMLEEQMALRYFVPKISAIHSIRDEYGYSYWDVTTDRGNCRFTVRMGSGSVSPIGENRYLAVDIDGNRFEIPDITRLNARELKMLDLYI